MDENFIQRLIATVTIGAAFLAISAMLGIQVILHQSPDSFLVLAWGTILGQYIKLLGIDTGSGIANQTIKTMNGASSTQAVATSQNTAAMNANTAAMTAIGNQQPKA